MTSLSQLAETDMASLVGSPCQLALHVYLHGAASCSKYRSRARVKQVEPLVAGYNAAAAYSQLMRPYRSVMLHRTRDMFYGMFDFLDRTR